VPNDDDDDDDDDDDSQQNRLVEGYKKLNKIKTTSNL
jgi:hypothetical protein